MLAEADRRWLDDSAELLDSGNALASEVVPRLAGAGLFGLGVPRDLGGQGGDVRDAVEAIATVAGYSLAAAFTFWGQRAFIEYLLQSPNAGLRERWLPGLLNGSQAGATGLSNAMKYLGGIESLQITATPEGEGWRLDGVVPWCTNLRPQGFAAAVAVQRAKGGAPLVAVLTAGQLGVTRSDDLDLIALRGSNTASLHIEGARLEAAEVIHEEANRFLPAIRPDFLGLQCGLSIGLARAALATAAERSGAGRAVLEGPIAAQQERLAATVDALYEGLADRRFRTQPEALFRARLALADIAQGAVQLELQASGGRGYHRDQPLTFARRWREAAFIPIVTPSVVQLQGELAKRAAQQAAAAASAP
ncbi:acyl-CoA dehydrogenase family protein [Variovorax sp. 770b2]|uniref:acyl-CoA dehydrogenase family protein n=1 Tax=Variovorax sp. 770b2 TaxID=1566271 RepID=UPI0008F14BC5|nr:acyl-CoA dehydrogenase family protein [Variovorax sp. 770b2]SFQ35035.1 Acyl-CoA dehydrogenase [Variovorax sp. 770b2]